MKCIKSHLLKILILSLVLIVCRNETEPPPSPHDDTYDIDIHGIPKFAEVNYIELSKIHKISKFRSSVGHNYWDDFEQCRSLKHYFHPKDTIDWSSIKIYSPIKGTIFKMFQEWAGTQVHIKSDMYPAFYFIIFHINLLSTLNTGDKVNAGQQLGTHIGSQTMSDIAVGVSTPKGWKLISYFDVITDSVFYEYQARGINSRLDLIISKEARDSDTLRCSGDTFLNTGTLENWVILNEGS